MKRLLIVLLLNIGIILTGRADQNLSIDSMINLVEDGKLPDTTIAFLQYEIGYNLRVTDQARAHRYVDRAILKALELKNEHILNHAYRIKGIIYATQREYTQSFEYLYKAIAYGQKHSDYDLLAACYMSLGDILRISRSFVLAEKYIYKALVYHCLSGNLVFAGYSKRMLANIMYSQEQYIKALSYYKEALRHYKAYRMNQYIYGNFNDIGLCYGKLGKYKEARANFDSSLYYASRFDPIFCGIVYGNIGELFMLQGQQDSALKYLNYDLKYNRKNQFEKSSLMNTYSQVASMFEAKGKLGIALQYLDSAIEVTHTPIMIKMQYKLNVYRQKAALLNKMGRHKEAFSVLNKLLTLSNEMQEQNDNVNTLESQIGMELNSKEKEVSLLEAKLDSEQLFTRYFIFSIVVLVLGIIIILIYYTQSKGRLKNLRIQYALIEKQQLELDKKNNEIEVNNERLKAANEKLSELNEEKNEFIRLVVHDLKNPLSRVQGLTELIEMEPDTKVSEQQEKMEYIRLSVEEMNSLIERFLDVNRIEAGQQRIAVSETDIVKLVQEETAHLNLQAKEKMIDIQLKLENQVSGIETDPGIVRLIYTNLLSNAIKFSPFNKPIYITISDSEEHIMVRVKDLGPGLSEFDKQNMFKKFTRLSARPTGNESSTGLGLYLVKIMSEKVGIQVSFESILGMGTEMRMTIPRRNR
ncbi:MAG: tetratricopeptide repeat-containing sensor histidine kinase [Bacteroidia bacterium]|jgi:signal transduction histidine kinase